MQFKDFYAYLPLQIQFSCPIHLTWPPHRISDASWGCRVETDSKGHFSSDSCSKCIQKYSMYHKKKCFEINQALEMFSQVRKSLIRCKRIATWWLFWGKKVMRYSPTFLPKVVSYIIALRVMTVLISRTRRGSVAIVCFMSTSLGIILKINLSSSVAFGLEMTGTNTVQPWFLRSPNLALSVAHMHSEGKQAWI